MLSVGECLTTVFEIIQFQTQLLGNLTYILTADLISISPDRILQLDEVTGKLSAVENAHEYATFTEDLRVCQDMMKKRPEDEDFVKVIQSTDKFIFSVESTGGMDAEDILISSLKVLKDRLNYLAQEVENLKDL